MQQPQPDQKKREETIAEALAFVPDLKAEIARTLVGQEHLLQALLVGLFTNGHVLVEGVPGLAKTLAIRVLARAIGGTFARVQFTPDLLPADLTGTTVYNPHEHTFTARKGPIFANIVLADEINRAPAKVQSALLEAMQERQVSLGGTTYALPDPFLVMATQNPIEHEGTYALPEAQIDRFMLNVRVSYPGREEERLVIERMAHPVTALEVKQLVTLEQVIRARSAVDLVYADPKLTEYILDIVFATRPQCRDRLSPQQKDARLGDLADMIEYGASPRAGLGLTLAAKAWAFLEGRSYALPQDVKAVAPDVLRHRLIVTYEAEAESVTSEMIVKRLLDELRTP